MYSPAPCPPPSPPSQAVYATLRLQELLWDHHIQTAKAHHLWSLRPPHKKGSDAAPEPLLRAKPLHLVCCINDIKTNRVLSEVGHMIQGLDTGHVIQCM